MFKLGILMALIFAAGGARAETCEGLKAVARPDVTVLEAVTVPEGSYDQAGRPAPPPAGVLPAHCRVRGVIRPTADSEIGFEVWLPREDRWNGRFQGFGNGGFAGSIRYVGGMVEAVRRGYATASTDTGHSGGAGDADWARGHPEKIVDFGHRAIHLMTVEAKALARDYYGRAPHRAYFAACSNGGRQALMEAQRYPEDYDGIIAGAPAADWTGLMSAFAWNARALGFNPASLIPPAKTPAIAAAVLKSCDALDGVTDGVVGDPRRCRFDPVVLQCAGEEADACLTTAQVAALRAIYAGAQDGRGRRIYPGWSPGGEAGFTPGMGWEGWMFSARKTGDSQVSLLTSFMRNMASADPAWSPAAFDFDRDPAAMAAGVGEVVNAVDPDLGRFAARGGRLIIFHGWSDPAIAPQASIDYYEKVQARMGREPTAEFMRLFMVPGLQHCMGGTGPNSVGGLTAAHLPADPGADLSAALEGWVEHGVAPDEVRAADYENLFEGLFDPSKGKVRRTGKVCAYPKVAAWTGRGATDSAASYRCVAKASGA